MPVYKLDKLMEETRRLAAEYRASTGTTLPVSTEIAKYDAVRILGLETPPISERSVDALRVLGSTTQKVQIKARVIFNREKTSYRVGQLNVEADWDITLLVILDDQYCTQSIYEMTRSELEGAFPDPEALKKSARGAMSVNKFKAIGMLRWDSGANQSTEPD